MLYNSLKGMYADLKFLFPLLMFISDFNKPRVYTEQNVRMLVQL